MPHTYADIRHSTKSVLFHTAQAVSVIRFPFAFENFHIFFEGARKTLSNMSAILRLHYKYSNLFPNVQKISRHSSFVSRLFLIFVP